MSCLKSHQWFTITYLYLSILELPPLRPFPTIKMINIGDSFILNKKLF